MRGRLTGYAGLRVGRGWVGRGRERVVREGV